MRSWTGIESRSPSPLKKLVSVLPTSSQESPPSMDPVPLPAPVRRTHSVSSEGQLLSARRTSRRQESVLPEVLLISRTIWLEALSSELLLLPRSP